MHLCLLRIGYIQTYNLLHCWLPAYSLMASSLPVQTSLSYPSIPDNYSLSLIIVETKQIGCFLGLPENGYQELRSHTPRLTPHPLLASLFAGVTATPFPDLLLLSCEAFLLALLRQVYCYHLKSMIKQLSARFDLQLLHWYNYFSEVPVSLKIISENCSWFRCSLHISWHIDVLHLVQLDICHPYFYYLNGTHLFLLLYGHAVWKFLDIFQHCLSMLFS